MDGQGAQGTMPAGWYHGEGDPPGTKRYWDGSAWTGEPQVMSDSGPPAAGAVGSGSVGMATVDGGPAPASVGARLGGRVLDFILFLIPLNIVVSSQIDMTELLDSIEAGGDIDFSSVTIDNGPLIVVAVVAVWAIQTAFVALLGATPGKLAFGTRVAAIATRSTPPSWGVAAIRTSVTLLVAVVGISWAVGNIVSLLVLLIGLASLILLFTDDRRQTVMDKLAKTVVVNN